MNRPPLLAHLIRQRNAAETEISTLTGRPASIGHLGEYIAARIFNIALLPSASNKALDGHFMDGPLAGRSVNVKWYARHEGVLDITPDVLPDYYLVMAGPKLTAALARTIVRPWLIQSVYLFDVPQLIQQLLPAGVALGIATSVRKDYWTRAEIYPRPTNPLLPLTDEQQEALALFR